MWIPLVQGWGSTEGQGRWGLKLGAQRKGPCQCHSWHSLSPRALVRRRLRRVGGGWDFCLGARDTVWDVRVAQDLLWAV